MPDDNNQRCIELEKNIKAAEELLGDYERSYDREKEPGEKRGFQENIEKLKERIKGYRDELRSLRPTPLNILPSPESPIPLIGREKELKQISRNLSSAQSFLIIGETGLGKTSLLRTILAGSDITANYGANRFYIACGQSTSVSALVATISNVVCQNYSSIPLEREVGLIDCLKSVDSGKTLLALDDIDNLLRRDPQKVNELLSLLAKFCTLIMAVSRCEQFPPISLEEKMPLGDAVQLNEFSRSEAALAFENIVDSSNLDQSGLALLLDQIADQGKVAPLTVSLLAHRAKTDKNYSLLAGEWGYLRRDLVLPWNESRKVTDLQIACHMALTNPQITQNDDFMKGLKEIIKNEKCLCDSEAVLCFDLGLCDSKKNGKLFEPVRDYLQNKYERLEAEAQNTLPAEKARDEAAREGEKSIRKDFSLNTAKALLELISLAEAMAAQKASTES